jgi:hypothetical protein
VPGAVHRRGRGLGPDYHCATWRCAVGWGGHLWTHTQVVVTAEGCEGTPPTDPRDDIDGPNDDEDDAGNLIASDPLGDLNCDGVTDLADINPFVLYLSNFGLWQATYASCDPLNGDINGDGTYPSFGDINPFVALLTGK